MGQINRDDMTAAGAADPGWSHYWAQGHLHSCPTTFSGFYGPQTQALWQRFASRLGPADRVLELGCGNGGLLRFLAGQFEVGTEPTLIGVDAAQLNPTGQVGDEGAGATPRFTLHSETAFDALEPTAEFTGLISQFAFEYGATESAWDAVGGAIAPQCNLCWVLHKQGSRLQRVAQDECVVLRALLEPQGVLERAAQMLPLLLQAATPAGRQALNSSPAAVATRSHYNAAVAGLMEQARALTHGGYAEESLQQISVLLGSVPQLGRARAETELQQLRSGLVAHLARLDALCASALDAPAIEQYRTRLERLGFRSITVSTLSEHGEEMGWVLEGLREQ